MNYMMMPLDRHYDHGFGATGDAFFEAAKTLEKEAKPTLFLDALPKGFLLRHALELFLKSAIVVIHRRLKLPYDDQPFNSSPRVLVGTQWIPLFRVHSIAKLYAYWRSLVVQHADALVNLTKHKPDLAIPEGLDDAIAFIEKTDPEGTYYRYPANRDPSEDKLKSPFKEVSQEQLFPADLAEGKKITALIMENQDNEFVRAFVLDDTTEKDALAALFKTTEWFSGFHFMTRLELTGGS